MLSIEEIKLLKEKLLKLKGTDWEKFLNEQIQILEDLEYAVDANNQQVIDRLDKTPEWFQKDLDHKLNYPVVDHMLYEAVQRKIFQFAKTNIYNSLEIGPGNGMFSKEFRAWRKNYFIDVLPGVERKIRRRFKPAANKHLTFYTTKKHECFNIPQNSCNFVFSWDTFVFFTQNHIQHYLHDIKRIIVPGGYVFIHYADCHYDQDLAQAKRGYWNYNTKTAMKQICMDEGYEIVEMNQFRAGASYVVLRKPGNLNPFVYKISEITLD